MADEEKKIIVDDDWKAQAQREKENLAAQEQARQAQPQGPDEIGFPDIVNLLAVQAMVGLGLVSSPTGERIPPSPEVARHFIDLLEVLQKKTRNNLDADEKRMLDQVTYDLRMRFVEMMQAARGAAPPPDVSGPPQPGAGG